MFERVLSEDAKNSLALLGKSGLLVNAYLAGGTALALQFGHRYSYDFDFFTQEEFDSRILIQRIARIIPSFKPEKTAWGTILGYIQDTRFSLFFYKYPLISRSREFLGINVADSKDIAPMKVAAIADRGLKRDFIDLYFILEKQRILTLGDALDLYDKKFGVLQQNKVHILKSLNYFDDADKDEVPQMIEPIDWLTVKKFFEREVRILSEELLG